MVSSTFTVASGRTKTSKNSKASNAATRTSMQGEEPGLKRGLTAGEKMGFI